MPIGTLQTGPGVFEIGEEGSLTLFQSQVTSIAVKPSVDKGDPRPVLSGERLPGERTESFTVEGSLIQDFGVAAPAVSISEWTFTNRGKVLPFRFLPNNTSAKQITGTLQVEATDIGGDVEKVNDSDFSFPVIEGPEITAAPVTP